MATVANSGAGGLPRLRPAGRRRRLHRRGDRLARRCCRAGSCAVARMALSILYSSGAIGGCLAAKLILPWAMQAGGLARRLVGDRRAVGAGRRARADVRARTARRHGPSRRRGSRPMATRPAPRRSAPPHSSPTRPGSSATSCAALPTGSSSARWSAAAAATRCSSRTASCTAGSRPLRPAIARSAVSTMTWTGLIAKAIIMLFGDRLDPSAICGPSSWLFFGVGARDHRRCRARVLAGGRVRRPASASASAAAWCVSWPCSATTTASRRSRCCRGIAIAINTTLSAIAPYVAGFLFDRGYGYDGICYFLAGWCFVGALVLFADPQACSAVRSGGRMKPVKEGALALDTRRRAPGALASDALPALAGRSAAASSTDYEALWRWSVADLPAFWQSHGRFLRPAVLAHRRTQVLGRREMPGAEWFPGARLNYAAHALRHERAGEDALVHLSERRPLAAMSWPEFARQVRVLATWMRALGVMPGRPRRRLSTEHARGHRSPCTPRRASARCGRAAGRTSARAACSIATRSSRPS